MKNHTNQNLLLNVFLFFINSIGSKILIFLLIPFYAKFLNPSDYGKGDFIYSTSLILCEILNLKMSDALLRFGMEPNADLKKILNNVLFVIFCSFTLLSIFIYSGVYFFHFDKYYLYILLIYLLFSINDCFIQYCKATNKLKIFAFDGLISAFFLFLFSILLIGFFKIKIHGYLLSYAISLLISILYLYCFGNIKIDFYNYNYKNYIFREMLQYSIPIVPSSISWSLMSIINKFTIKYYVGLYSLGIYSMSYRIPAIMEILSNIFIKSWLLSVIDEFEYGKNFEKFGFIYKSYEGIIFVISSLILLLNDYLGKILYSQEFMKAIEYTPLIIFSLLFNSLQAFFGVFFNAFKKTNELFKITIFGCIINLIALFIFVPKIGIYGAIIATFLNFSIIFILMIIKTRKYVSFKINYLLLIINIIIVLFQAIILSFFNNMILYNTILFVIILIINFNRIKVILSIIFKRIKK